MAVILTLSVIFFGSGKDATKGSTAVARWRTDRSLPGNATETLEVRIGMGKKGSMSAPVSAGTTCTKHLCIA